MGKVKLGLKSKISKYVTEWERRGYAGGIPDEAPAVFERLGKVPSYRRICLAILKNDVALQSLGFDPPKSIVYMQLKKIEIENRDGHKFVQLKLFD